jgi:hypothetical protein
MKHTLALLVAVALLAAIPPPAEARACGAVTARSHVFIVGGSDNLSCRFMRRWTRRFVRAGSKPVGWRCRRSSPQSGGCNERRGRKRFFVFYPPD